MHTEANNIIAETNFLINFYPNFVSNYATKWALVELEKMEKVVPKMFQKSREGILGILLKKEGFWAFLFFRLNKII
jgi:hypothetical protein